MGAWKLWCCPLARPSRYQTDGTPGEQVVAMFKGEIGNAAITRMKAPHPLVQATLAARADADPEGFKLDMAQFGGRVSYEFRWVDDGQH
jgi:hypothetical protein